MPRADLVIAVEAEDVPALRAAVRACSSAEELNEPDGDGICAFLYACIRGHVECMKMLADAGCDTAVKCEKGGTALMAAARSGVPAAARLVLDEGWCELEATSSTGETAFLIACSMGHTEIMEMLVDEDCDTGATNNVGRNALMGAAASGMPAALRMAMDEGWCALEARGENAGATAFLWAANQGHADCMQILADAGCDTAATDKVGSALTNTVASQVPAAVTLALEKGWGELEARNDEGLTAYLLSCSCMPSSFCRCPSAAANVEILEMLADAGCDLSAEAEDPNGRPWTAMDLAKLRALHDNDDTLLERLRELLHERKSQQKLAALKQEAHELMEYDRFTDAAALLTQALRLKPGCEELQALLDAAKSRAAAQLEKREHRAAQAEAELLAMLDEEEGKAGKQKSKKQEKTKINQQDKVKQTEEMKSAEAEEKRQRKREKRARQRERQRQAKLAAATDQPLPNKKQVEADPEPKTEETSKPDKPDKPEPQPAEDPVGVIKKLPANAQSSELAVAEPEPHGGETEKLEQITRADEKDSDCASLWRRYAGEHEFMGREEYTLFCVEVASYPGMDDEKWARELQSLETDEASGISFANFGLLYTDRFTSVGNRNAERDLAWLEKREQMLAAGELNLQSPWVKVTCGERAFYDNSASEVSSLKPPPEGIRGERDIPPKPDPAKYAAHWDFEADLVTAGKMDAGEIKLGDNPQSKWTKHSCGERSFFYNHRSKAYSLKPPTEGVKKEKMLVVQSGQGLREDARDVEKTQIKSIAWCGGPLEEFERSFITAGKHDSGELNPESDRHIKDVLGQVHPEAMIDCGGLQRVYDLCSDAARRLLAAVSAGAGSVTEADCVFGDERVDALVTAAKNVFRGQLGDIAVSEMSKRNARSFTKDHIVGMCAGVGGEQMSETFGEAVSAVAEYVCAEVLDLGGRCARDHHRNTITARDVQLCVTYDDELVSSFSALISASYEVNGLSDWIKVSCGARCYYLNRRHMPRSAGRMHSAVSSLKLPPEGVYCEKEQEPEDFEKEFVRAGKIDSGEISPDPAGCREAEEKRHRKRQQSARQAKLTAAQRESDTEKNAEVETEASVPAAEPAIDRKIIDEHELERLMALQLGLGPPAAQVTLETPASAPKTQPDPQRPVKTRTEDPGQAECPDGHSILSPSATLIIATLQGDPTAVQATLDGEDCCDLECREPDSGNTAFLLACILGNVECMKLLVDARCDTSATNSHGLTALMAAATSSVPAALRMALNSGWCSLDARNNIGITAFMIACIKGSVECIQLLVDEGCDTAVVDDNGANVLIRAAGMGVPTAVRTILDEEWCELEAQDSSGATAFLYACRKGKTDVMKMLVDAGCDTTVDDRGQNALMAVAVSGVPAAVRMALDAKWCELEAQDVDGATAFLYAVATDRAPTEQENVECVEMFVRAGCNTEVQGNETGETVADMAKRGDGLLAARLRELEHDRKVERRAAALKHEAQQSMEAGRFGQAANLVKKAVHRAAKPAERGGYTRSAKAGGARASRRAGRGRAAGDG
eukprot:COSAG04_NODE_48_length_31217_cov_204.046758_7_plen_1532_part_00